MMVKDLLIKGFKSPHRVPRYLWCRYIKKRVPFTYKAVAGAELPQFSARLYREVKLLNEAVGGFRAKRSLEIGCGYGRFTPWIAEYSDQHYAVEPESVLLNDAKKLYHNFYFYQAKAQKLPFPDCYFDLCVSWTVLQHIPPTELTKATAEIKRVCAPEAIIILCEEVGKSKKYGFWQHTLEEWMSLFLPWKITWHTPFQHGVLVMRFEREIKPST